MITTNQKTALFGASFLTFVLGSLHAYSVLLLAMEAEFGVSRSAASLTYSIALASLATAVLLTHRLYYRLPPPTYVFMTGILATAGCVLAALGSSKSLIWLGYGLIFGCANGLGYGYALQFSGRVLPERRGFAMGIVTAAYALGAVFFPIPLSIAINFGGWTAALLLLALCLLLVSTFSALTLWRSRMIYAFATETNVCSSAGMGRHVAWLWVSYCGAVTAGLMVMGHATGLVDSRGGGAVWVTGAPIVIASANMAGSLMSGVLTDRLGGRSVLVCLSVMSALSLLIMAVAAQHTTTLIGLAVVGFTYGGTIAAYPAYVSIRFGATAGTVIYSRVFTAWAAAGLLGPSVAGMLYDHNQSYLFALLFAAFAAALSVAVLLART